VPACLTESPFTAVVHNPDGHRSLAPDRRGVPALRRRTDCNGAGRGSSRKTRAFAGGRLVITVTLCNAAQTDTTQRVRLKVQ
jgi:hypothetical protein